ncbi:MAG: hypothetical protein NTW28_25165 [Candidatus Solibacter sp.]|nr:hypothetical protein [Candidatus Solibacter sp.]
MISTTLTQDERALIEELDNAIANNQRQTLEFQNQRAGAMTMLLRARKIREGQWDFRNGALVRVDAEGQVPILVRNAIAARDANQAELGIQFAQEAVAGGDASATPRLVQAACLGDLCRYEEALEVIEKALRECSEDQHELIRHERGFQRLLNKQWKDGWADWDCRVQHRQMGENLEKAWPGIKEWDGSPNRRVLVCGEKGLGDSVLFARYLKVLLDRGCTLQFLAGKASTAFSEVLRGRPGIYGAYGGDDAVPQVSEMWISLESLPRFLADSGEIPAPFDFQTTWNPPPRAGRPLRVGICWHGHTVFSASKHRRPEDLKYWEPILAKGGVEFLSLQLGERGPCAEELPANSSVLDTVRRACSCDLVISMDTSVVHMTASAGVPIWMPLHKLNYWPWIMTDAEHTVWYPSMRVFRQDGDGWEGVFHEIAEQLQSKVREG